VAVCGGGLVLALLTDGGSATPVRSLGATGSYVIARRVLAEHMERSLTTRRNAAKGYVGGIAATCAGALKDAPPIKGGPRYGRKGSALVLDAQAVLFSDATGGIERTMDVVDANATRELAREARGLRWSDPMEAKLVAALAEVEDAQLELQIPKLCSDARAWAASGYRSIATRPNGAAERFAAAEGVLTQRLAEQGCVSPYPGRAVLHVLEQRVPGGQRTSAEETSRLEASIARENAATVNTAIAEIERILGTRLHAGNGRPRAGGAGPVCIAVPRPGSQD